MRILVVGAGAVGGYFGGRLLAGGRAVTFLVRPRRAAELAERGLAIRSQLGDVDIPSPPTITADALRQPYDVILLSCKAYDLEGAIESCAPAVGPETSILPVLNGIRQLEILDARFGSNAVLGGLCIISSALDSEARIVHFNDLHGLVFGERDGRRSGRVERIAAEFSGCNFEPRMSEMILQEMWEKWVFIAAGAGLTCLMRATVGDIVAAGAAGLAITLLDECAAIATKNGYVPREEWIARSRAMFTTPGSLLTASMFRDIERRGPIEADHMLGDLLRRGGTAPTDGTSLLRVCYLHLKAYEARREREAKSAAG
jgi:2-dehydropantoate 2-reductase